MTGIEGEVTHLGNGLQLLHRLGAIRSDFESLRTHMLCPTVACDMENTFKKIIKIGEKSAPAEADVQAAQALMQKLQDGLDNVGRADDGFTVKLKNEVTEYKSDFGSNGETGKTETCKQIRQALPGLFAQLDRINPDKVGPENYLSVDTVLCKLRLIKTYCRLVEILDGKDPRRTVRVDLGKPLLEHLKNDSWEDISAAELLVQEISENHFRKDIEDAIAEHRAMISPDQTTIHQLAPCGFRVELLPPGLDTAAARQEWICQWDFSRHGKEPMYSEEGWRVAHYFQRAARYNVKVTLIHNDDGKKLPLNEAGGHIDVLPESRRGVGKALRKLFHRRGKEALADDTGGGTVSSRLVEILRLGLALGIALLGLLAGAKEQVLKLDIVPAMIAIFLLGFGADQIKNLMTQRQQTSG